MMDRTAFHAHLKFLGWSVRDFSTALIQYVVSVAVFLIIAVILFTVLVLRVTHRQQDKELGMGCLGHFEERARSRLWRRVARRLLPRRASRRLHEWFGDIWIARRKDRSFLERQLIPAVGRRGGKALFIGCHKYTKHYPALLLAQGVECWTIDIDPTVARWGAPGRHVIGDNQAAPDHWPPSSFDTIILNGVFGFGLNSVRDQDAALRACRQLLANDGRLVLGWNTDRCVDPSELPTLRNCSTPSSFPGLAQRQTFAISMHEYGTFMTVEVADR
jgi:hypothetical protein